MTELEAAHKRIEQLGAELAAMRATVEPVAEMVPFHTPSGKRVAVISRFQHLPIGTKLYTTPQPTHAQTGAVPMTNAQREKIIEAVDWYNFPQDVIDAVERAHGIKGGQHGADT